MRASLYPEDVSVIPNAIDTSRFVPDPSAADPNKITIVVLSRLVYRKGIDLLIDIIPEISKTYPEVHWIIGGDGPKRVDLEEVREKHQLHERIEILGSVPHSEVRNVLVRGNIFINCSLTEAFCIAIVEAASCGLLVVSTRVGGVPEVLPDGLALLAEPTTGDLSEKVCMAIDRYREVDHDNYHRTVKECYSWYDVAARTEKVYQHISDQETLPLVERLRRFYSCGTFAGKVFCLWVICGFLIWQFYCWLWPEDTIDRAPDFDWHKYQEKQKGGQKNDTLELPLDS